MSEDLQLALLLRQHLRDVAAVREERVLALDDAKALNAVAEERGHRDAAVLDLGVAKVAGGLTAHASQKPGLSPPTSPPRGRSAHRAPMSRD